MRAGVTGSTPGSGAAAATQFDPGVTQPTGRQASDKQRAAAAPLHSARRPALQQLQAVACRHDLRVPRLVCRAGGERGCSSAPQSATRSCIDVHSGAAALRPAASSSARPVPPGIVSRGGPLSPIESDSGVSWNSSGVRSLVTGVAGTCSRAGPGTRCGEPGLIRTRRRRVERGHGPRAW